MAMYEFMQQMMGAGPWNFGFSGGFIGLMLLAAIWSLVWKGLALWKSAKRNEPVWFVALLVINTLGILEILYLYVFSEMKKKK